MKKQILFVDDEPNVLNGLQRMLRGFRNEWDMYFALSGAAALDIIETKPIDVIISDMRMPRMNGAELLQEVMRRRPGTIRIILSGQADSDLILKSFGVAHQYISKPCNSETFKSSVFRAIELRKLLQDENLKALVSNMGELPSVPALYVEMAQELQALEASIPKVGQIVARDPAMTTKILQLANSAFFGRQHQISSASEAVAYLGLDLIRNLFLAVHAFKQFEPSKKCQFSIEQLWEHSISTATIARKIAKEEEADNKLADDAFTAGLLHDIGKLILACRLPEAYAEAEGRAKMNGLPLWLAEYQVLSTTHAEVGAYLFGLWGLSDSIVEATAYHHSPSKSSNSRFSALTAVHAADCQNDTRMNIGTPAPQPDLIYLSKTLPEWSKDRENLNARPLDRDRSQF
jgi:putative nucleotidyltransferase with HDIG domain